MLIVFCRAQGYHTKLGFKIKTFNALPKERANDKTSAKDHNFCHFRSVFVFKYPLISTNNT